MSDEYKVKKFLKHHLDLVDVENYEFLYLLAYNELSWSECSTLNDMLATAEINYKPYLERAILTIMSNVVKVVNNWRSGVSAMPLDMFVDAFFDNLLGMSNRQIREILFVYRENWIDDVIIKLDGGVLIIEKVHKK